MYKMRVKSMKSRVLKAHRALNVVPATDDQEAHINYTGIETPLFVSNVDIEKDVMVDVEIKNNPVWEIEAGEDIATGQEVKVGKSGKVYPRLVPDEETVEVFGYALNDVKKGEIANIVRFYKIGESWADKLKEIEDGIDGDDGSDGKDAEDVGTAELDTDAKTIKEAINELFALVSE